jgi:hypothetical protein
VPPSPLMSTGAGRVSPVVCSVVSLTGAGGPVGTLSSTALPPPPPQPATSTSVHPKTDRRLIAMSSRDHGSDVCSAAGRGPSAETDLPALQLRPVRRRIDAARGHRYDVNANLIVKRDGERQGQGGPKATCPAWRRNGQMFVLQTAQEEDCRRPLDKRSRSVGAEDAPRFRGGTNGARSTM